LSLKKKNNPRYLDQFRFICIKISRKILFLNSVKVDYIKYDLNYRKINNIQKIIEKNNRFIILLYFFYK